MNEILTVVIPSIVTAIIGYFVGFRKNNVDICGARLDELEKSLVVYNNIIRDMSEKITDLRGEIKLLEDSVNKLMSENRKLKKTQNK
jgi:uncharacterized coiled-coil protein SlyX